MSFEEQLTASIDRAVTEADLPAGDVERAATHGSRIRRTRRMAAIGGCCAVLLGVSATAALWRPGNDAPPPPFTPDPEVAGGWVEAAPAPLSPRYGSLMVWTGDEVLVMGGHSDAPCPPGADCVLPDDNLDDAAAFDPKENRWREIANPPFPVDRGSHAVTVDGVVVIGGRRSWWIYDAATDDWTPVDTPDQVRGGPRAELDGRVYTVDQNRNISILEVSTRSWSTLPQDDLEPALVPEGLFATDAGIVISGVNYEEAAPDEPTLTQADIWDGDAWARLPRTGMIGWLYYWTGERILGIERGGADGGQTNNWGRYYPAAGALDPATGEWEPLPGLDDYDSTPERSWDVDAADGPLVASGGRVYDDRTRTWSVPGVPDSEVDTELSAVWADGRLVVFGGFDNDARGLGGDQDHAEGLSNEAWIWTP